MGISPTATVSLRNACCLPLCSQFVEQVRIRRVCHAIERGNAKHDALGLAVHLRILCGANESVSQTAEYAFDEPKVKAKGRRRIST